MQTNKVKKFLQNLLITQYMIKIHDNNGFFSTENSYIYKSKILELLAYRYLDFCKNTKNYFLKQFSRFRLVLEICLEFINIGNGSISIKSVSILANDLKMTNYRICKYFKRIGCVIDSFNIRLKRKFLIKNMFYTKKKLGLIWNIV